MRLSPEVCRSLSPGFSFTWFFSTKLSTFQWQHGYGAFSVSQSDTERVITYIREQEQHHRKMTFQEEYRLLLRRYQVAFDERYVWD